MGGFAANGCSPALSMTASAVAQWATDRSLSASPLPQGITQEQSIGSNTEIVLLGYKPRRFTSVSLRRAGQATLIASGSTGKALDGRLTPSP